MDIKQEDKPYLINALKAGEVTLVLGAGASFGSRNLYGEPIKIGLALAEAIAKKAGIEYNQETLPEVLGAVRGNILSDSVIVQLLTREYKGCVPSKEMSDLFSFVWKRVYTWNIDDGIENIRKSGSQSKRFYNGMIDKAAQFEGPNVVHVVHLHGEVAKPEHGMILTEQDYSHHVKNDKHFWYQRLSQDYLETCPVFIGSKLAEPIMMAEIERAKRDGNIVQGKAFLITPDSLSVIQISNLKSKGIVHIKSTLEDFVRWLLVELPGGWGPRDVVSENNEFSKEIVASIPFDEVQAAHSLRPINPAELRKSFSTIKSPDQDRIARNFLEGFQPSWVIAASGIPVWLEASHGLYSALDIAFQQHQKILVVTGQAGSGKTTALMQAVLKYRELNGIDVYELRKDVKLFSKAFSLLKRLHARKVIVYIGDMYVYGDSFRDYLETISGENVLIVSTARSAEWGEHLVRYLGNVVQPYIFQRFVRNDYEPLIEKLVKYVPSPTFRMAKKTDQIAKLANSRSQLLIALREATGSEKFNDIITSEYQGLPDSDTKRLFLIVGLATLARIGISAATAKEAYSYIAESRTFEQAVAALDGIVAENDNGRLVARHDLYVRHILESVTNMDQIIVCIVSILRTYIKFDIPVIKSVGRSEYILFKAITNHSFVMTMAKFHGSPRKGLEIYQDFEVDFQLDGHYWLQYGLYSANSNLMDRAIYLLKKSIEAYPENEFAIHALADVQLRMARERTVYDATAKALISEAVSMLNSQDARSQIELDRYPIMTLVNGHIGALIRHDQKVSAREFALKYFERVKILDKEISSLELQRVKERLVKFITLGEWSDRNKIKRRTRRSERNLRETHSYTASKNFSSDRNHADNLNAAKPIDASARHKSRRRKRKPKRNDN